MMSTRRTMAVACAAALLAVPVLAEDLTITFKTTGGGGAGTETSYYSSEKMRTGHGDSETIVEYATGKITSIDHKKKEYSEITLAEMETAMKAAAAKMEQANAQMKQQMASMPPAVREKMEQMMGGAAGAVTVTKGGSRQVAGYTCQDYTVAMGASMTTKVCATTALQFPAPNVDYAKFASFAGMGAALAGNPMFKNMGKLTDEMAKIQGFRIAESTSVNVMGRSTDSSKEAVEIKKGPIAASAFDVATIAKGYKKVPHPATQMK
ncbi:MAG TPA: DUF4412 domain-containing protein [Vicinamibacteria bacterium]|nr:DUF4412 domain-containing protein [Vicinamibacteria bacterium]